MICTLLICSQNVFWEMKAPKHSLHYLLPSVKASHNWMVL